MSSQENDEKLALATAMELGHTMKLVLLMNSVLELDILEILASAEDSLPPAEIASRIRAANPEAPMILDRILRFLASYSIVSYTTRIGANVERAYGVGPLTRFFLKNRGDGEGSLRSVYLLSTDKVCVGAWYHIKNAILEGGIPFHKAHGKSFFEYASEDARFNQVFNNAMSDIDAMIMKDTLDKYKGFGMVNKVLVDVGSGVGSTLHIIISKYPNIRGINFDLSHVISQASMYPGIKNVAGDMFEKVPTGDAMLLKTVLHDWDDEHCMKLLKNCWKSLPNGGKVIIIERVLPRDPKNNMSSHASLGLDLYMLTQMPGGKERSPSQYELLGLQSGFSSFHVASSNGDHWVMELHK